METLIVILVLYFLPTILAELRRQPNHLSIFVVNLFLGWTLLGWVIALAWAVSAVKEKRKDA